MSSDGGKRKRMTSGSLVEALQRGPSKEQLRRWDINGKPHYMVACPSCSVQVRVADMDTHLDLCLKKSFAVCDEERLPCFSSWDVVKETAERLENGPEVNGDSKCEHMESTVRFRDWKPSYPKRPRPPPTTEPEPAPPRENDAKEKFPEEFGDISDDGFQRRHGVPYYLRAHLVVVEFLKSAHDHLLTDLDRDIVRKFDDLPIGAKKLAVRLYRRKHTWYRTTHLRYDDIEGGLDDAIAELMACGVLQTPESDVIDHASELLHCLRAEELRKLADPMTSGGKTMSKAAAESIIQSRLRDSASRTIAGLTVAQSMVLRIIRAAGKVVRIHHDVQDLFDRAHTVFFSTDRKDSPALMLADLGKINFPKYVCRITCPTFPSREALDRFLEARKCEKSFEDAAMAQDYENMCTIGSQAEEKLREHFFSHGGAECRELDGVLAHPFLRRMSHLWVLAGVAWHSVAAQERLRDHEGAVRRLRLVLNCGLTPHRHGKMLNRLTIDLKDHVEQPEEALRLCLEGLKVDEEWTIQRGERLQLAKRGKRLWRILYKDTPMPLEVSRLILSDTAVWAGRSWPEKMIFGRPLNEYRKEGFGSVYIGYDGERVSVETLCLQCYRAEGEWNGMHCEDVADVFQTPFQDAPLDLGTEAFYTLRRKEIRSRLEEIGAMSGASIEQEVAQAWEDREGVVCRGVSWKNLDPQLPKIAKCIGGKTLATVFRQLAIDYTYWSGGLPDLLLWKGEDQAMFVEVKGPRDSLMERQRAWLHELLACGARVEICKVVEQVTPRNQDRIGGDLDGHQLRRLDRSEDGSV